MLNFEYAGFADVAAAELQATRARSLADDLDRLLSGKQPFAEQLAKAPLLERWSVVAARVPVLQGIAIGHPSELGTFAPMSTAPLVIAAEDRRWIRCWDGFWRLGRIEDGQDSVWSDPSVTIREWR